MSSQRTDTNEQSECLEWALHTAHPMLLALFAVMQILEENSTMSSSQGYCRKPCWNLTCGARIVCNNERVGCPSRKAKKRTNIDSVYCAVPVLYNPGMGGECAQPCVPASRWHDSILNFLACIVQIGIISNLNNSKRRVFCCCSLSHHLQGER